MIAKRLREHAVRYANDYGYNVAHDLNKAADHIEALEKARWPKEPPTLGANYTAGLWSRRNYAAMIEDFNAGGNE